MSRTTGSPSTSLRPRRTLPIRSTHLSGHQKVDNYLANFLRLPKTDYTYADTETYRSEYHGRDYDIPNMTRYMLSSEMSSEHHSTPPPSLSTRHPSPSTSHHSPSSISDTSSMQLRSRSILRTTPSRLVAPAPQTRYTQTTPHPSTVSDNHSASCSLSWYSVLIQSIKHWWMKRRSRTSSYNKNNNNRSHSFPTTISSSSLSYHDDKTEITTTTMSKIISTTIETITHPIQSIMSPLLITSSQTSRESRTRFCLPFCCTFCWLLPLLLSCVVLCLMWPMREKMMENTIWNQSSNKTEIIRETDILRLIEKVVKNEITHLNQIYVQQLEKIKTSISREENEEMLAAAMFKYTESFERTINSIKHDLKNYQDTKTDQDMRTGAEYDAKLRGLQAKLEEMLLQFSDWRDQEFISLSDHASLLNSALEKQETRLRADINDVTVALQELRVKQVQDADEDKILSNINRVLDRRLSEIVAQVTASRADSQDESRHPELNQEEVKTILLPILAAEKTRIITELLPEVSLQISDSKADTEARFLSLVDARLADLMARVDQKLLAQQQEVQQNLTAVEAKVSGLVASLDLLVTDLAETKSQSSDISVQLDSFTASEADKLTTLKEELLALRSEIHHKNSIPWSVESEITAADDKKVQAIVDRALLRFSADKTGMADYAQESAGGSVVSTLCSETFHLKTALFSMWGVPLFYQTYSPRTVIQPGVNPGECWAFKGTVGHLVIKLAKPIRPTMFTLEHIPKSLVTDSISSAPKDFTVYGMVDDDYTKRVSLGNYTYNVESGNPMQSFVVQVVDSPIIEFVWFSVRSNYGNQEYTCVYRFRVHGTRPTSQ